jgi:hypothetical protein
VPCFASSIGDAPSAEDIPWFPGIMKHWGPSYSFIFDMPGGISGLSTAICSALYQHGGCIAYSKGLKKRLSYVNDEGFGYLHIFKWQKRINFLKHNLHGGD